jgi:dTDP-4-dehydrorhamnose reductase
MNVYMTGGSGLLGTEIRKHDPTVIAPPESDVDITDIDALERSVVTFGPDMILHCAAATKPPEHNNDPLLGLRVNIIGTANVAQVCAKHRIRLIFTSSDYVYSGPGPHREDEPVSAPNNFYLSKLAGECAVRMVPGSLVLRLSFGPRPFPWDQVYRDQWTSKLYVDEIAPLVLAAVRSTATGIMNIGGPRTTLEAYARRTKPNIQTIDRPAWVPRDTSLETHALTSILGITK